MDLPILLGKITKEAWVDSIASALSDQIPLRHARDLGMALADAPFRADDVVVAMLRRVRGHVPLVLVTNATLELERDLESMGLADFADHVVSSARVGVAKPDQVIYEIAAERAGVAAHRCLFVDDRWENVETAVSLGMTGVHYQGPADLQKGLSTRRLRSPSPSAPAQGLFGVRSCGGAKAADPDDRTPQLKPGQVAVRHLVVTSGHATLHLVDQPFHSVALSVEIRVMGDRTPAPVPRFLRFAA